MQGISKEAMPSTLIHNTSSNYMWQNLHHYFASYPSMWLCNAMFWWL
jgi:hypothetical protein